MDGRRHYHGVRQPTSEYGYFFSDREDTRPTSLFFTPSFLQNRRQEKMRQRFYTSYDEYGNFYTKKFQLPPIVSAEKEMERRKETPYTPSVSERKQWKLPDIEQIKQANELEDVDNSDNDKYNGLSLNEIIKLPEVKQIDISLHLADDSTVTLHTLPKRSQHKY